jgi:hypothetical protein
VVVNIALGGGFPLSLRVGLLQRESFESYWDADEFG